MEGYGDTDYHQATHCFELMGWPLEQVFQPPMLVLGILFLWLECSSFRPVVDAQLMMRRPFAVVRNRFALANVKISSNTAQLLDIPRNRARGAKARKREE